MDLSDSRDKISDIFPSTQCQICIFNMFEATLYKLLFFRHTDATSVSSPVTGGCSSDTNSTMAAPRDRIEDTRRILGELNSFVECSEKPNKTQKRKDTVKEIFNLLKVDPLRVEKIFKDKKALKKIIATTKADSQWAKRCNDNPCLSTDFPNQMCLNGIYLCTNGKDLCKHALAYAEGNVKVMSEMAGKIVGCVSFESALEYIQFQNLSKVMGLNVIEHHKNNKKPGTTTRKGRFFIKVSVYAINASTWTPNCKEIEIDTSAHRELQRIEKYFSEGLFQKASSATSRFFNTYGSHVYVGKHVLGGMYLLRTCGTDEKNVQNQHDVFVDGILSMQLSVTDKFQYIAKTFGMLAQNLEVPVGTKVFRFGK